MKRILFLDAGSRGTQAVTQFGQVAGLFRSSFDVAAKDPTAVTDADTVSAKLIAFDDAVKARFPTAEVWSIGELEPRLNQLLAELMGGGAAYVPLPPTPPAKAKSLGTVKVSRETAGRRGKGVTVVSDLNLSEDALKELATRLKTKCGSGGTAKDGRIEIQGDHRDTVSAELQKIGYTVKRSGG
jgi:predicted translation initiation factor SUI1